MQGILKGKYHSTIVLLFDWFVSVGQLTFYVFYLQNRLIKICQTGCQWYKDTSPFSIPWCMLQFCFKIHFVHTCMLCITVTR